MVYELITSTIIAISGFFLNIIAILFIVKEKKFDGAKIELKKLYSYLKIYFEVSVDSRMRQTLILIADCFDKLTTIKAKGRYTDGFLGFLVATFLYFLVIAYGWSFFWENLKVDPKSTWIAYSAFHSIILFAPLYLFFLISLYLSIRTWIIIFNIIIDRNIWITWGISIICLMTSILIGGINMHLLIGLSYWFVGVSDIGTWMTPRIFEGSVGWIKLVLLNDLVADNACLPANGGDGNCKNVSLGGLDLVLFSYVVSLPFLILVLAGLLQVAFWISGRFLKLFFAIVGSRVTDETIVPNLLVAFLVYTAFLILILQILGVQDLSKLIDAVDALRVSN